MEPTEVVAAVRERVSIFRDAHGVPHIFGESPDDCYVGLGICMAQDRPRQLDWLRRRSAGRLAEVYGQDYVRQDLEARTLGFRQIAEAALAGSDGATGRALASFAEGVNAAVSTRALSSPSIEDVTAPSTEPWTPIDSLAIMRAFAWQLSGRLAHILAVDLAEKMLPPALATRFLASYHGDASIVGGPRAGSSWPEQGMEGSNSWVTSPVGNDTGYALLASDPHLPPEVPGLFYEASLSWGSTMTAGLCHAGVPGFMIGRNQNVAWGITNNLCSARDLYRDPSNPHPGVRMRREIINVKDAPAITLDVLATPSGTIVNHLLDAAGDGEPISLRWTGSTPSDEVGSLLRMQGARSVSEFREALSPWHCPTWNFTFCDTTGAVAYQCAGAIPLHGRRYQGLRDASDVQDAWQKVVTTEDLPGITNPPAGRIVTANNRIDPDDAVTEQNGFWLSSVRADRIHELLAAASGHSSKAFEEIQSDVTSVSVLESARHLLDLVADVPIGDLASRCKELLAGWEGGYQPESVGATIFEAFWAQWVRSLVAEHFTEEQAPVVMPRAEPFAHWLLLNDESDWFANRTAGDVARASFVSAVERLADELSGDASTWQWGRVHFWPESGELDTSFAGYGVGLPGGRNTVNNGHYNTRSSFVPTVIAANRVVVSLAPDGGIRCSSCTGNPERTEEGAPAGFDEWLAGDYHELWRDRSSLEDDCTAHVVLTPAESEA